MNFTNPGTYIIGILPVKNINNFYIDYQSEGFDIDISTSFSFDDKNWSEYFSNPDKLIGEINSYQQEQTFLKFKIVLTRNPIQNNYLNYSFFNITNISVNSLLNKIKWVYQLKEENNGILLRSNDPNLFNPYQNTENIQELKDTLSRGIYDIFGLPIEYYKVVPDIETKDHTFKSYREFDALVKRSIKFQLVNNQIPDNRYDYSEYDVDFMDGIEGHIVISRWNEVFPEYPQPESNDFIWFPMMNRLYKVNTANPINQFMNIPSYFQFQLVKWEEDAKINYTVNDWEEYVDPLDEINQEQTDKEMTDAIGGPNQPVGSDVDPDIKVPIQDDDDHLYYMPKYYYLLEGDNIEYSQLGYKLEIDGSKIEEQEFSLLFWYQTKEILLPIHNIFSLIQEDGKVYSGYLENSYFIFDYTNLFQKNQLKTTQNQIDPGEIYGIGVSYINNDQKKFLAIVVFDKDLNIIGENFVQDQDRFTLIQELRFYNGNKISNIRVKKSFNSKDRMKNDLQDLLPESSQYHLIDNPSPGTAGDKYVVR